MNHEQDLNDPVVRAVLAEIVKRPAGHGYQQVEVEGFSHAEIEGAVVKLAAADYVYAILVPATFGRRADWQPSVLTERGRRLLAGLSSE